MLNMKGVFGAVIRVAIALCCLASPPAAFAQVTSSPADSSKDTSPPPTAAATAPTPAKEPTLPIQVGYDKGFFIRSLDSKFELRLGARFHALYAFDSLDNGSDRVRDHKSAFSISTARINMKGKAFLEGLCYSVEADFGKGFVKLLDANVDYAFVPSVFHLRVGVWKHPFSRPFITASGKQEMVERNIASQYFGEGYDIGLALHDNYETSPSFEWVVGLVNGYTADKPTFVGNGTGTVSSDGQTTTDKVTSGSFTNYPLKFKPALVARAGYNCNGIVGYSEADFEGGPLRFAVAGNLMLNFNYDNTNNSGIVSGIDYVLKVQGLSFSGAFYHAFSQNKQKTNTSFVDQVYKAMGLYVQAGYLITGRFQPVVRFSLISPDLNKSAQEIAAGFSIYFAKHNFKWQTFFAALINNTVLSDKPVAGYDFIDYQVHTHMVFAF
jgi:hypothetical protein